jgi:hypothetical protein
VVKIRAAHLTAVACSYLLPGEIRSGTTVNPSLQHRGPRVLAASAVLTVAFTFLAAQVDFVRRNRIGLTAERYWWPQLLRIWLPGFGLALVLGLLAFVLHRRARRA